MSRTAALKYVEKLLNSGYTVDKAEAESGLGVTDLGGPGYEIRRGVIEVPMFSGQKFRFRALAKEVLAGAKEPPPHQSRSASVSRASGGPSVAAARADERSPKKRRRAKKTSRIANG